MFAGKPRKGSPRRRILSERERHMDNNLEPQDGRSGRVFAGLIIIAAGLAMLSDRIGISAVHLSGRYWPFLLVAFGLVRWLEPPMRRNGRRRSPRAGAWFVYLGLWGFVNEFHLLGFDYDTSWPLLIVGAGIWIIWRAFESGNHSCQRIEGS